MLTYHLLSTKCFRQKKNYHLAAGYTICAIFGEGGGTFQRFLNTLENRNYPLADVVIILICDYKSLDFA